MCTLVPEKLPPSPVEPIPLLHESSRSGSCQRRGDQDVVLQGAPGLVLPLPEAQEISTAVFLPGR